MKKIGYLSAAPRVSTSPNAEASGPRAHVLGVIHAFDEIGWGVSTFIVGDRMPEKVFKNSEKQLNSSPFRAFLADIVRLGMGYFSSTRAKRELINKVDWVYERFAVLQSLGRVFKKNGVPWILETNGPFFYEAKTERKSVILSNLAKKLELRAYRECDVLVCVSEALRDIVIRETGISNDKIVLVPNGVDTAFFNPANYNSKLETEKLTIGFIGSLLEWQGIDLLLEAVYNLIEKGLPLQVVIVGDGLQRRELELKASRLGISPKVIFTGRVSLNEVPQCIANFDIGYSGQINLKSEKMYHSPLKLYEYMSMAKPVIASNFDDARKLIHGKKSGFLFNPGDLGDLMRVIEEAYNSKNLLRKMGETARGEIVLNHSWIARIKEMIPKVEEILRSKHDQITLLNKGVYKSDNDA